MKESDFLGGIARSLPFWCGAFLVGILNYYLSTRMDFVLYSIIVSIGFVCVFLLYTRSRAQKHHRTIPSREWLVSLLGLVIFCTVGIYVTYLYESSRVPPPYAPWGQSVRITGTVTEYPDHRPDGQFITISPNIVGNQPPHFLIRVKLSRSENVQFGDTLLLRGTLEKPKNFTTKSGAEFDYAMYLSVRDIYAELKNPILLSQTHTTNRSVPSLVYSLRDRIESILETSLDPSAFGLVAGIVLGSRSGLTGDDMQIFQASGVSHIVVLSGFNVTIVAVAITFFCNFLGIKKNHSGIMAIIGIGLFVLFAGMTPSVVRAGIMACILVLIQMSSLRYESWRALLYAVVVMSTLNPRIVLFDAGFQLSVFATIGIVCLAPKLKKYFHYIPKQYEIRDTIVSTLCAIIATLPILVISLHSFSAMSLVSNILIVPIVSVVMCIGFCVIVFTPLVSFLGDFFSILLYWLCNYIITIAEFTAKCNTEYVLVNIGIFIATVFLVLGIPYLISLHYPQNKKT